MENIKVDKMFDDINLQSRVNNYIKEDNSGIDISVFKVIYIKAYVIFKEYYTRTEL